MSMGGSGFGSFMEGLAGGMGTMQDIRSKRQKQKLYDYAIGDAENAWAAQNRSRELAGGLPSRKHPLDADPYLFRAINRLGGRDTGGLTADEFVVPETAVPVSPDVQQIPFDQNAPALGMEEIPQFAEGGFVDELGNWIDDAPEKVRDKDIKDAAARNRANKPGGEPTARTQSVEGDPSKYKSVRKGQVGNAAAETAAPSRAASAVRSALPSMNAPKGAGWARRAINSQAGKAGALGALVGTGITAAGTPTEQYRQRFHLETDDPSFLGDVGVRALGAASDLGNALTFGAAGRMAYRDADASAPGAIPTPAAAPAPAQAPAALPAEAGPAPAPGRRRAVPAAPVPDDPATQIDFTGLKAEDIPPFPTKDWEKHREDRVRELVDHGMTYAEAWDKVDQATIATQQRGFLSFAKQADAFLKIGDMKGAGAAARMAFQYVPTGSDIRVGEYKGHLVAVPFDEETGQPEGQPVVITPKLLEDVMINFADPGNFAQLALDRKKVDILQQTANTAEDRLNQVDIPQTEALIDLRNAQAGAKVAGAGRTEVDRARAQPLIESGAQIIADKLGAGRDSETILLLQRAIEQIYMEGKDDPNAVVQQLLVFVQQPGGLEKLRAQLGGG